MRQWNPNKVAGLEMHKECSVQTNFTCPEQEVVVAFELPSSPDAVVQLWSYTICINCPVCGGSHEVDYRDVYLVGLMKELKCIPADVQRARLH